MKWLIDVRGRVPLPATIVLGALPILSGLVVWWWITRGEPEERVINRLILPSPGEVADRVPDFLKNDLAGNTWASSKRIGLGFLIAVAIVAPLGILMGAFGSVRACFNPLMTGSGYLPFTALGPLTMAWFGTEEWQKRLFLAIAFAIFLLPMIVKAIDGVGDVYLRTARTLGASRLQIVTRVLIPIAGPDIWHALRLAVGVGWTYLVFTEMQILAGGLGGIIGMSQRRADPAKVYLVILVIMVIAWLSDLLWEHVGRFLFPYRRSAA